VTAGTLAGRTVIVTRPVAQAGPLVEMLEQRGARALRAPAVRIVPAPSGELDRALRDLSKGRYDWLVLTSQAGVAAVRRRARVVGVSPGEIRASVAAIGDGTARALRRWGIDPSLVPPDFTTEALGASLPVGTGRVLLARADISPEGLEEAVRAKGWDPVRIDAYRTELARRMPSAVRRALETGAADAVTFTSASTVSGFLGVAGPSWERAARLPLVVSIGPVTAAAARTAGLMVDAEARPHTIEGLVAALERVLGRSSRRR
jgi:uroporphyrinogen-III synthase